MSVDIEERMPALMALGDPIRWRIVEALTREELCVCHLVEDLGVSQSLISHHLRTLRRAGVVESERFRYWTYYKLRPQALRSLAQRLNKVAGATPSCSRRACC
jgi:ArsR family transcriptional regulator